MSKKFGSIANMFGKTASGPDFKTTVKEHVDSVISSYFSSKSPNANALIANRIDGLNYTDQQIKLIVAGVNNAIFLKIYSGTSNNQNREVDFDIASLDKIKGSLKTDKANNVETQEKTASAINTSKVVYMSSHPCLPNFELVTPGTLDASRIVNAIEKTASERDALAVSISNDIDTVTGVLLKCASLNNNAQTVFDKMCVDGAIKMKTQLILKEAFSIFKNEDTEELKPTPIAEMENYNLGEYSQNKTTSDVPILSEVVDKKRIIKDYSNLVSLATKIQQDQETIAAIQNKTDEQRAILSKYESN